MSAAAIMRAHLMRLYHAHLADEMIPTSNRFLVYELIQEGVINKHPTGILKPGAKMQRRTDRNVIDALTQLRERGDIPWDAIVDETHSFDDFTGYPSIASGIDAVLDRIKLDPWADDWPLMLTESRSLAGVLRALLSGHRAMITSTNGQTAGFLRNEVIPRLHDGQHVGYFGDLDLGGGQIEANTRRVLERESGYTLQWERLALTPEQVRHYRLTPIIKTDGRHKGGRGRHQAVETEALSQRTIVDIARNWLNGLLPQPLADVHNEREQAERERLRRVLRRAR